MSSYVEVFKSKVDFPKPFQRTGKFPLDRTDLFSSYVDAVKYAAGDRKNPDSRGLCGTSYVGQIITVYENDVVTVYKINANRTLSPISDELLEIKGSIPVGELSASISLPEGSSVVEINISDSTTGEKVFTDVSNLNNVVTVSISEEYTNPLEIVVYYRN